MAQRTVNNPPFGWKHNGDVVDDITELFSYVPTYKVYRALLTQTGTDAPLPIVLENTLSGDLTWSYNAAGSYGATLVGEFTADKTFIFIGQVAPDTVVSTNRLDVDTVTVKTYDISSAGLTDSRLQSNSLEIRVYD